MVQYFKDENNCRLTDMGWNIAQFVSVGPDMQIRHARINHALHNVCIIDLESTIEALFKVSKKKLLNIRTFHPKSYQSRAFIPGLKTVADIMDHLNQVTDEGLYAIVSEMIDPNDGGVSCVIQNNVIEFSPQVMPRFVEAARSPIVNFDRAFGLKLLSTVYDIPLSKLNFPQDVRVEFNIHPEKQGFLQDRITIWEMHEVEPTEMVTSLNWPNAFSRFIGDKAFGLLVAHILGYNVPLSKVYVWDDSAFIFSFGKITGKKELWMRTCPTVSIPGKFSTIRGYVNPYQLMAHDDPRRQHIASCIAQSEINAVWSGSLISSKDGITIEGVRGFGDQFMIGNEAPVSLPGEVTEAVLATYDNLQKDLGPVRIEWVYDGEQVWIVQLHLGETVSYGNVIVPVGESRRYVDFHTYEGLDRLRSRIKTTPKEITIRVVGNVGLTSHIADVLRKAQHPSFIESYPKEDQHIVDKLADNLDEI